MDSAPYLWLFYALYAALAYGVTRLLYRSLMKRHSAYAFALILSFGGFLASLLFVGLEFDVPSGWWPWTLVALSTLLWAVILWIANLSYKHTPVSVREPIAQTELAWLFLLTVILLNERVTFLKVFGIACIFAGMLLVTLHRRFVRASLSNYGVRMTLLTAALTALVSVVDKLAVAYFSPGAYNAILYLLPGLALLCFLPGHVQETKSLLRWRWKALIAASFLSASMYFAVLKAYSLAEASQVYPLTLLGSVIAICGGMLLFREERVRVARKVLAAFLIIIGALAIAGTTLW